MVMAATVDLPRQASTSSPQTRLWGGNIKSRGESYDSIFCYWTLYWSFESKFNKIGRKLGPHRCSEVRCIEPTVGAPSHLIHRGSNQMSCLDWRVKSTPSSDIGPPSIWGTCYVDLWGVWEGGICIPDICHGRHGHTRVNFFLAGVNFYRFNAKIGNLLCIYCNNAKNWQFTVYFVVIYAFFWCKFYSPKILSV